MCQIGEGIAMYANNHAGRFPDDLESLFINQDLTTGAFVCPSSSNTPAPIAPTTQATAAGLRQPGHCSYIYLGNGLTDHTATPDMVLLYEPLSNHALSAQGMNVLFGDFRVEWLPASDAQVILNQVAARTSPVRFPTTAPAPNAK